MGIQSEIIDGIGHIRLDRAEKANAYDQAHLVALRDAFRALSPLTSVVVISSMSDRAFCAGADLDEMKQATPEDAQNLLSQAVFTAIARASAVSMAVVDGPAVAGGCELALAADLRVSGSGAQFRLPETRLGIIPAAGGCTRLTGLLGASVAKQVILGGGNINAVQAVTWGLGRAGDDDPMAVATAWAAQIRDSSPEARSAAKRIIDQAAEDASLLAERTAQSVLYAKR